MRAKNRLQNAGDAAALAAARKQGALVNEIGRQLWGEGATGKFGVDGAHDLEVFLEGGELHEVE